MKDQATIAIEREQLLRWTAMKARAVLGAGRVLTWGEFLEQALTEYAARHRLTEPSPAATIGHPLSKEEMEQVAKEIVERYGDTLVRRLQRRQSRTALAARKSDRLKGVTNDKRSALRTRVHRPAGEGADGPEPA